MAKITAYGLTEMVKVKARFDCNKEGAEYTGLVSTFVVRSDGAILKKSPGGKRYVVWQKFKPEAVPQTRQDASAKLQRIVRVMGYTVVSVS